MRILNVNMSLDPVMGGGTAERTFQMSRYLAGAGMECTILTTDLGLTEERLTAMKGVDVVALPCLLKRFYIPSFLPSEIRKVVEEADIIHLMNHWTFINALVYYAAKKLSKPYVVCPAGALLFYGRSKAIKKIYNRTVGYDMISGAQGHVAISEGEVPHFRDYGVDENKITLIPNGVDAEAFQERNDKEFRLKFGLGDNPFILFVGRLNVIKGPDILLDAFCLLRDRLKGIDLVFAGPDEGMRSHLKVGGEKAGVADRVHFIDYIDGRDKSRAYHAAELLVIPSRQEAMSIVVLEAGITGTPVLLTDRCGFDVESIGGGLVVSASADGVRDGLLRLLEEKPHGLKSLGEKLRRHVSEHYTWDVVIDKYIKLYREILATGRK